MTLEEFYKELAKLDLAIYSGSNKEIRLFDNISEYCPITAICKTKLNREFPIYQWNQASNLLGLRYRTAQRIVCAADNDILDSPIQNIRKKLLKILELKEGMTLEREESK